MQPKPIFDAGIIPLIECAFLSVAFCLRRRQFGAALLSVREVALLFLLNLGLSQGCNAGNEQGTMNGGRTLAPSPVRSSQAKGCSRYLVRVYWNAVIV